MRRSARTNKGKNSRLERERREEERAIIVKSETPKKRSATPVSNGRKKRRSSSRAASVADTKRVYEPDSVRCACGKEGELTNFDDKTVWVQCEACLTWQHAFCILGMNDVQKLPAHYFCHFCKPHIYPSGPFILSESHSSPSSTLINETNEPQIIDNKSQVIDNDPNLSVNENDINNECDSDPEFEPDENDRGDVPVVSDVEKDSSPDPKDPSNPNPNKPKESKEPTEPSISDIQDKVRKSVAKALYDIFMKTVIPEALRNNILPTETQTEQLSTKFALDIESALFTELADKWNKKDVGSRYRDMFRTISFNLRDPKNPEFRSRIIKNELISTELVNLSSEEMLNPELKQMAKSVRAESINQSVLKVEEGNRQRIRRTHKGEEIVEDENDDQTSALDSLLTSTVDMNRDPLTESTLSGNTSSDDSSEYSDHDTTKSPSIIKDQLPIESNHYAPPDIGYSPPGSPKLDGNGHHSILDDNDLEKIIQDTTTTTEPRDVKVHVQHRHTLWTGRVSMPNITTIDAKTVFLGSTEKLGKDADFSVLFNGSSHLNIEGRLSDSRAIPYLQAVSNSKTIVALELQLIPEHPTTEQEVQFNDLFNYFNSLSKYGVFTNTNPQLIKDFYIISLSTSEKLPSYLNSLHFKQDMKNRKNNMLILIFVINSNSLKRRRQSSQPINVTPPIPVVTNSQSNTNDILTQLGLSSSDIAYLQSVLLANPEITNNPALLADPQFFSSLIQGRSL